MEERFDFGVTDRLGRTMGYVILRQATRGGYERGTPGIYFSGSVTRNGKRHQAGTFFGPFETEADRDAKIVAVVEAARKRAHHPKARLKA
jgi:hypothetical protein